MWLKRCLFIIVLFTACVQVMVNEPCQGLKRIVLQPILGIYARQIDYGAHIEFIYQPGLRRLSTPKEELFLKAVIPAQNNDYIQIVEELLFKEGFALTQCSAMDHWHTTPSGQIYLEKMYKRGYRAVVFDGGHHLPTLGLSPDIIIVPQMYGYAVHSYMRDGMSIQKLQALAEELELPCVIAVLPRWSVIKEEQSLQMITQTIIRQSAYNSVPHHELKIHADNRISKYNHKILVYVDQPYFQQPELLIGKIRSLGIGDIDKIFLAFDYKQIGRQQGLDFERWLAKELDVMVETVNEPVYVFNAFWGDMSVLSQ